ncbi:MAG: hypothetical protein KGJ80_04460 [Chloroflexota bacterium]|nr:hypothetical protein [Chloroflexota bacterium]
MPRFAVVLYALMLWIFAVLGAVGVAYVLKLPPSDATLLIAAVAVIAIFGAFIPALRLGRKS